MKPGISTAAQQATKLIQEGFDAQSQGDPQCAWAAYQAALACVPEHPTALQLMGMLARQRGDAQMAEDLMRRSLKMFPAQPHVWNNLGNVLDAGQRLEEALNCFERAIALDDSYADAHYNRARLLSVLKRSPEAQAAVARAAAASPQPKPAVLQLQAQVQTESGQLQSALETLDRALSLLPASPPLLHNRAVLLQRLHRYAQALHDHEAALAAGLDEADGHYNRGNTLQSLGRHSEALAAYRQALLRQPGHALALYDLTRLSWRLGDPQFDTAVLQALAANPQALRLAGLHAHFLFQAERFAAAATAYRSAITLSPDAATLHDGLARSLARLGDLPGALTAHQQTLTLSPNDAELHAHHAASLLAAGQPAQALAAAETACMLAPKHQLAQAQRALALRVLGDPRALPLDDTESLVRVFDLSPPAGFADMESFNAALAAEVNRLHADRQAPIDQSLRGGTQTMGDIFDQGHPLVDLLKAQIAAAVETYIRELPDDTDGAAHAAHAERAQHPFLSRRSSAWHFADSWSSRLADQGFRTNHVHPHGWISSAYYVAVPTSVQQPEPADQTHGGWLQFGVPDTALPGLAAEHLVLRRVQPQPGRLVLFPSMFWHGTVPFRDEGPRLTIAFDVLPD